ncbi:MAG: hypothetical protein IH984_13645 [Planctomycetes bacterium]|nr:hypothetical protein [Planctomycetota bacterium]
MQPRWSTETGDSSACTGLFSFAVEDEFSVPKREIPVNVQAGITLGHHLELESQSRNWVLDDLLSNDPLLCLRLDCHRRIHHS